jgi:hypothetical protein
MTEFTIDTEETVNSYTSSAQTNSTVSGLADGGWVITWMSSGQDSSGYGIYQQRFSSDGSAFGSETQVNTFTSSGQEYSKVTALSDGGWVVTWMSYEQDGDGYGIYQQRYDADGTANGGEVLVNTTTVNDQSYPAVQALADGGWVVSWGTYSSSSYASSLYQQRYDSDGQANGDETLVAADTSSYYYGSMPRSSITDLPDGGWVVTWTNGGGYMSGSNSIYMQEYDSTGTAVGSTTTVASLYSYMYGTAAAPAITTLEDGGWVISWMDPYSGGLTMQRYDADGAASGSATTVSTGGYYYYSTGASGLVATSDGGWAVIWQQLNTADYTNDIYMQLFDSDGNSASDATVINTYTSGEQVAPSVSALDDGRFVVTFSSDNSDGDSYGISQSIVTLAESSTVTLDEDASHSFAQSEFTFSVEDGATLVSITVTALPANGTLTLDGETVSIGDTITAAELDTLVWAPDADDNGTSVATLKFTSLDGDNVVKYGSVKFDVTAVNDDPTASDNTVALTEDGNYTFAASDFGFSDVDGDSLGSVVISTLPSSGTLELNGVAVTSGQEITAADIGNLVWTPDADAAGTAVDSLAFTVKDGQGGTSDEYTLTFDVTAVADDPTAADDTITIDEDEAYTFSASDFGFSDLDGDTLASVTIGTIPSTGSLTLNGTAVQADDVIAVADIGNLVWTPAANVSGTAHDTLTFTVQDSSTASSTTHTITFDIDSVNDAPTSSDNTVSLSEDGSYTFSASDFDFSDAVEGDTLASVTITELPSSGSLTLGGVEVPSNTVIMVADLGDLVWTPDANDSGTGLDTLKFNVTDSGGATSASDYTITFDVSTINDAPTVENEIADQEAPEDSAFSFQFAASTFGDVDSGDTLTYTAELTNGDDLPSWLSFDAATRTFSGTPEQDDVGTISVKVTAKDGSNVTISTTFDIAIGETNDVPTVENSIADQNATEDSAFSFQFAASTFDDADSGDSLTYSATLADGSDLPSWLTFDAATRTFSGTPDNDDVGTISVKVIATDESDATASETFDITVGNVNDAPTVENEIADQEADEDSAFSFQFAASTFGEVDSDDALTYTAELANGDDLPSWLSFDPDTRTFSGTPEQDDVGTISVKVTAKDGSNVTVSSTFDIVIGETNDVPTVENSIADQTATEDSAFSFQFAASTFDDADSGDSLTYTATLADGSDLPSWLTFDAATRTFSGTPENDDVGTISVKVIATDESDATASETFDITVGNTNDALTVENEIADRTEAEDIGFSFQFAANVFGDVDSGDTLTYTAELANGDDLPSWLSFDADTRTFSGTPEQDDIGTISIKVTAKDGSNATASTTFDIVIGETNDAPTVANEIADQTATEDSAFSFQFAASTFADADSGDSLTYRATLADGSDLPSWLTFDAATRTFSGTPDNDDVGTISVKVIATDVSDATVSETFDITVGNVNDAPTGTEVTLDLAEDSSYSFAADDFGFADIEDDGFAGITVATLSRIGSLTLDGVAVTKDQFIAFDDLENLAWTAGADVNGDGMRAFTFTVTDDGGTEGGGVDTSASSYAITFDVSDVVDTFIGTKKNDTLVGTMGKDIINGNWGNDEITGGRGDDKLTGGNGNDQFFFQKGDGVDVIRDFDTHGKFEDIIDLSGVKSITSFKDLMNNHLEQHGKHLVIDADGHDQITILNTSIKDLEARNFDF